MDISWDFYETNAFLNGEIAYLFNLKLTLAEQMKYRRKHWRTNILLDDQLTVLRLCAILQVVSDHGDESPTRSDLNTF